MQLCGFIDWLFYSETYNPGLYFEIIFITAKTTTTTTTQLLSQSPCITYFLWCLLQNICRLSTKLIFIINKIGIATSSKQLLMFKFKTVHPNWYLSRSFRQNLFNFLQVIDKYSKYYSFICIFAF